MLAIYMTIILLTYKINPVFLPGNAANLQMPNEPNVQECDATDDAMKNCSRVTNYLNILLSS